LQWNSLRSGRGGFHVEDVNVLRLSSVKDGKIFSCEISNGSIVVAHNNANLNQMGRNTNWRSLGRVLRQSGNGRDGERKSS
jgi:hypothetical protein